MAKVSVAIIGLGYVGLPLALLTAKKGYGVTGIDLDANKVAAINKHRDPIGEEYIAKNIKNSKLKAATDFSAVSSASIVIVCVPTPVKNGRDPDLGPLKGACEMLAKELAKGTLVIIESTINPGVCDEVVIPLIEKTSGLKINRDFYVSHCPERINPGDKRWSVETIPRVAGSSSPTGLRRTLSFYESIIKAPIKPMASLKEAEAVKIVENSFRDVNIAFVNELAMSFTKLGINVKNVIDGAATKPFAFMPHYPSVGVGGHCIPVDPYYLIEYARGYGFEHEFLSLARSINDSMPEFTVSQLVEALGEAGLKIKGARVAVLGLAYKPNVGDDRESPSYKLIKILESKGAQVSTYDPYVISRSTAKSLGGALKNAQAIVVATNHKEFARLNPKYLTSKVFIDGQNAFSRSAFEAAGIIYKGIGR
ncbi:MAG TPA: nucleotide sugar dehydrogenase [Candidatus Saccharimonadales bacterium]|nr:nucleotide sugar dehydrogenase [Candidatus Saccharimonadales bacterium]